MADQYYCVKCKTKREMKDPQRVTMKNGKPALKGQCTVCGTTINTILSSDKKAQAYNNTVGAQILRPYFLCKKIQYKASAKQKAAITISYKLLQFR